MGRLRPCEVRAALPAPQAPEFQARPKAGAMATTPGDAWPAPCRCRQTYESCLRSLHRCAVISAASHNLSVEARSNVQLCSRAALT
jgi:hypothetical protein